MNLQSTIIFNFNQSVVIGLYLGISLKVCFIAGSGSELTYQLNKRNFISKQWQDFAASNRGRLET